MADKPLSIRISEEYLEVLKERVEEINEQVPEAKVSVNSVCRHAIEEYLARLHRKEVEVNLVFPFSDELGGYASDMSETTVRFYDEMEKVYYLADKPEILLNDKEENLDTNDKYSTLSHAQILKEAFAAIIYVMEQNEYKNKISNAKLKPWIETLERLEGYVGYHEVLETMNNKKFRQSNN